MQYKLIVNYDNIENSQPKEFVLPEFLRTSPISRPTKPESRDIPIESCLQLCLRSVYYLPPTVILNY
jgi:hypothetical protein